MSELTQIELDKKISELEDWLIDNPEHQNAVEVIQHLRELKNEQLKRTANG